jgi:hypothetical protein
MLQVASRKCNIRTKSSSVSNKRGSQARVSFLACANISSHRKANYGFSYRLSTVLQVYIQVRFVATQFDLSIVGSTARPGGVIRKSIAIIPSRHRYSFRFKICSSFPLFQENMLQTHQGRSSQAPNSLHSFHPSSSIPLPFSLATRSQVCHNLASALFLGRRLSSIVVDRPSLRRLVWIVWIVQAGPVGLLIGMTGASLGLTFLFLGFGKCFLEGCDELVIVV